MAIDDPLTTSSNGHAPTSPSRTGGTRSSGAPTLDQALAGLDALDGADRSTRGSLPHRIWRAAWPKLIAFGIILLVWQVAVWVHWKPYILQSLATAARHPWAPLGTSGFRQSC